MVTGVACGLQNRRGAPMVSWVGSIPTRSRLALRSPVCSRRRRTLGTVALVATLAVPSLAAQERPPAPVAADTVPAAVDTLPAAVDTVPNAADAIPESAVVTQAANLDGPSGTGQESVQPPVTPMGAFVRSLVVPGWGQAAVDQPGRGAFYFAAGTFTVFMVVQSQAELDAANRARPADPELVDSKKGKRETWIVLAIFVSLFSGVDAWVSAHLWDFEGEITPPEDGSPGVQFKYSVPVEGP